MSEVLKSSEVKKESSDTQKPVEVQEKKQSEKPQRTPVEIKKEALKSSKESLQKKRNAAKEIAEGAKVYQDGFASLEGLDGPWLVPARPDQKMVKKEDFERSQKELQEQEKKTRDSLREKHLAEIEEVVKNQRLSDIDGDARENAYNELIYSLVPEQKISEAKEALEKDEKFQKLSQEQKDKKIQQQVLSNLWALPSELQKTLLIDASKRGDMSGLLETLQKQFGVDEEQSQKLLLQLLDEGRVKDILLKNIQENGMLVSGIQQDSPLGKELTWIIDTNVSEYLWINPPQEWVIDTENFRWLKDILWGGYEDLVYAKDFILWDKHPLRKSRDAIIAGFEDEVAQIPEIDTKDGPEKVQEYRKSVEKAFTSSTGIEGRKAEKALQKMSHQKISPLIRFLADLFAPIGAMMDWKTGDFWRGYMNQRGADTKNENSASNENYEQYGKWSGGIEGLKPDSILWAANKYMGVNEQKDGNLIREMHKTAWFPGWPSDPWCMSFVQYVLRKDMGYSSEQIGIWPSPSAAAGHRIGRHTDSPQLGDIVLIRRKGGSWRHIAFFAGFEWDRVKLLGWNQSNSVCVTTYPKSSVVEYRTLQKDASSGPVENTTDSDTIAQKITSGMDAFPGSTLGSDKYPSREFLAKNGMTPEKVPMGMRVNNPFNIKFTGSAVQRSLFSWVLGKSEHTDQWDPQIVFSSPEAGMISGINLLKYKQKHRNLYTVNDLIANVPYWWTQWGSDNSMGKNAARQIADRVWIGVNDRIDLNNPDSLRKFAEALITQEHWSAWNIYFPVLASSISKISH